jgi:homoserine dehydrogenase
VLADVARVLAEHTISIASLIQHKAPDEVEGMRVQLVIMTHTAPTGAFRSAATDLNRLAWLAAPCVYYPVGD